MTLKEYVNKSIKKSELITNESLLLARFNKVVDRVDSHYCNNKRYSDLINMYYNYSGDGVWLIMIFVCLISYDSKLLTLDDNIIDIIVNGFFQEDLSVSYYSRYLDISLMDENVEWLKIFYYLYQNKLLFTDLGESFGLLLRYLNIYQSKQILKNDLCEYYKQLYDYYIPRVDEDVLSINSLEEIYLIVSKKMHEINDFLITYNQILFQPSDFLNIENIKKLENMDDDTKSGFINYFKAVYKLKVSIVCKLINILSKVSELSEEKDVVCKIIPFKRTSGKSQ